EKLLRDKISGLEPQEAAVLALLRSRLKAASSRRKPPTLREQLAASVKRTARRPRARRGSRVRAVSRPPNPTTNAARTVGSGA
ncbi:MAG: hypothetical protein WAU57_18795, partial [Xanthobacteraceae bacterium]